jgi:hypothetical protein
MKRDAKRAGKARIKRVPVTVHLKPEARQLLRGLAKFHKKSVSEYIRSVLSDGVESELHMIGSAMRVACYSKRRINNVMKKLAAGESL